MTEPPRYLDARVHIPGTFATSSLATDDVRLNANTAAQKTGGMCGCVYVAAPCDLFSTINSEAAWVTVSAKLEAFGRLRHTDHVQVVSDAQALRKAFDSIDADRLIAGIAVGAAVAFSGRPNWTEALGTAGVLYAGIADHVDQDVETQQLIRIVADLEDAGISVDVAGLSADSLQQACRSARYPVIASWGAALARSAAPSNLCDESLRSIASTGGVVHVGADEGRLRFVEGRRELLEESRDDLRRWLLDQNPLLTEVELHLAANQSHFFESLYEEIPRASVVNLVDHVNHIVRTIGVDHVGISSNFDGGGGLAGWDSALETPNVLHAMKIAGYVQTDIEKLCGGNLVRCLNDRTA